MSLERVVDHLRRVGAASVEDTTRWVSEVCGLLLHAPRPLEVRAELVQVGAPGVATVLEARPFDGTPRESVRQLAALAFELLKGSPPPEGPLGHDDFFGFRPELARLIAASLVGTGPTDVAAFLAQLQSLRSDTAAYRLNDTVSSQSKPDVPVALEGRLVGTLLGPYELVAALGSGGMGEVYRAKHARLGREVAVKVLRPEFAAMPDVVHRFFQEAKVVNDINHPHIVQIIDFVESPTAVFCVMELLHGRTLSQVMRDDGPLALVRIEGLMTQVCDAIAAAHARDVVHRDIKPDNLFVTVDAQGHEQMKVLDFGIARRLDPKDASRTQAGVVMGTPSYMAPEQAVGRPVDARADVYSLGVVLYELVSGASMASLSSAPVRLERTAGGEAVSKRLGEAIEASLQVDPVRRPASVQVMRDALSPPLVKQRAKWPWAVASALAAGGAMTLWWSSDAEVQTAAPVIDAGIVTSVTVITPVVEIDAGVAVPEVPRVSERPAHHKKLAEVRRRYARLVKQFGAGQLTSIERQVIESALNAPKSTSPRELADLIGDAEASLRDAERRLEH